ncbi:MAG: DUF2750 domain-containing protein [Verrucomicrobiota bacterium]
MNPKQIEAVLGLPAPNRYEHFIKVVADRQLAWGLYSEGWALAANSEGERVFPLWPEKEYVKIAAVGEWTGYESREIDMEDLLGGLLPSLSERGTILGIFPTPKDKGVLPEIASFENDLRNEVAKFD